MVDTITGPNRNRHSCGTAGITLVSGSMTERAPIHLGSGEPILLLHPFMMSQNVWKKVAPLIADTGRYEVFAPTMAGHNGGSSGPLFLHSGALADDVERRLDALGWDTAHIVGNSLGGWVAFELERRGRARTLTAIAPAGGWSHFTPAKFEIVGKFVAGLPLWLLTMALGPRVLSLPFCSSARLSARQRHSRRPVGRRPARHHRRRLALPGVLPAAGEVAVAAGPAGAGRGQRADAPRHLREGPCAAASAVHPSLHQSPAVDTQITHLDGVGHIPMFEAPGRIADLIVDFVDGYAAPPKTEATG